MSKLIPGNQKHLTLDDRLYIQNSLDRGLSFKDISKFLCKDPTTISKEVRLHRILTNHPELDVSVKTLYNYIDQGILLTRNIDLKRKPKFKPRKTEQTRITNREVFHHRSYQDFQALHLNHFTEMDTVISAKGSDKCILTFFLPESELFLAYLLTDAPQAQSERSLIDWKRHSALTGF